MRAAAIPALLGLALLGLMIAAPPAHAETRLASYSTWILGGERVRLDVRFPTAAAPQVTANGIPSVQDVAQYVLKHVGISAGDKQCPAINQGYDIGRVDILARTPAFYRFETFFRCPGAGRIVLTNTLPAVLGGTAIDYTRIQTGAQGYALNLFTPDRTHLALAPNGAPPPSPGLEHFARMGLAHVLRNPVGLGVLLALLFLARGWRDLAYAGGGLAAGYALSLAAMLSGFVVPNVALTNAAAAFLIVLVAAQAVARESGQAGRVRWVALGGYMLLALGALIMGTRTQSFLLLGAGIFSASYLAIAAKRPATGLIVWLPAAVFGFVDGFNLFPDLSVMALPAGIALPMFGGFNLGVFLTDAILVSAGAGLFAALRIGRPRFSRPLAADLSAAALSGLGVYWLVSSLSL